MFAMDEQPNQAPIRVLIVDNHTLFREGLAGLLAGVPDLTVADHFGTAQEALEFVAHRPVDLILLDFRLDDDPASQFISSARRGGYAGKILIVTGKLTAEESLKALQLGASGIFLKLNPPATLAKAIRLVMSGHIWMDQEVVRIMAEAVQPEDRHLGQKLTDRERHVLRGILEGLTNKKIGEEIGVSEGTVKATLQQLFHKTGVRTRSQLVRVALEWPLGAARR
jgi:DNA-binding NarL/FixJ family response regulator